MNTKNQISNQDGDVDPSDSNNASNPYSLKDQKSNKKLKSSNSISSEAKKEEMK